MTRLLARLTPLQQITFGFVLVICLGAVLLALPWSVSSGHSQPFLDALFCATSAVTTTGLVVVDTGSFYSRFGQTVILILFQVGGLGYMLLIAVILSGLGGLSLSSRMLLRESLARPPKVESLRFSRFILLVTLSVELLGTLGLAWLWHRKVPVGEALYQGAFHAVSAFCTAGFSLASDNLGGFRTTTTMHAIIAVLTLLGGLGFLVLYELGSLIRRSAEPKSKGLSLHTRLVIKTTLVLGVSGSVLIWLGNRSMATAGQGQQWLDASFHALSASTTTGFSMIDIGSLPTASLWVMILLMFIGASPGGSGGGVKTVSLVLVLAYLRSHLSGRDETLLSKSRIPVNTINKALSLCLLAALWVVVVTGILLYTEQAGGIRVLFEVVSALGTVGLSTGLTSALTSTGKVLIILSMFIGRLGPLAIVYSLFGQSKPNHFSYPDAQLIVS